MDSFGKRRTRQTSTSLRGLIFLVVICRLASRGTSSAEGQLAAESNSSPTNRSSSTGGRDQQRQLAAVATQQTACDSLFIANEKLAKYCFCKDRQQQLPFESFNSADQREQPPSRPPVAVQQISRLSCQPNDLGQMSEDLASALWGRNRENETDSELTFQVDYLHINTNITAAPTTIVVGSDRWLTERRRRRRRFQIDHISLQLRMHDESPAAAGAEVATAQRIQAESQLTTIEDKMIDFCGLINETHLQFLSIFIGAHETERAMAPMNQVAEIPLTKLLAKLSSLTKLELSFDIKSHRLVMEREMFRHQTHLKWLNLASNKKLKLIDHDFARKRSPFSLSTHLESMSLESCNLDKFPLFSLFPMQFKLAPAHQQSLHSPFNNSSSQHQVFIKSVFGLPNLSTLNLASNELKSLEYDLFSSFDNVANSTRTICQPDLVHESTSKVFVLPSLTQLDLSENRLEGLTFKAGQYILCTMPNLSQLFLRRNKIKQLNLNSLIVYPTILPRSVAQPDPVGGELFAKPFGRQTRASKLEYLDLSSNDLIHLSAIVPFAQDPHGIRIRSINLSRNKLTNLITLLNATLIDRLIFDESFQFTPGDDIEMRLDRLNHLFRLTKAGSRISICDYLSPRLLKKSKLSESNNMEDSLVNEIIMSENRLSQLTGDDFSGQQCADIQILRLSGNKIKSISDKAFGTLINLEQLDLSSNALVFLEPTTFIHNTRLRILNLSKNRIKALDKRLFADLVDLEEISLHDNELSEIPSEMFARTGKLSVLDLSANGLAYLDEAILSKLHHLRVLDLNGNQLKNTNYLSLFKQIDNVKTMNTVMFHPKTKSADITSTKQKQSVASRTTQHGGSTNRVKARRNRDTSEDASNIFILSGNQLEAFNHVTSSDSCNQQTFTLSVQDLWLNDNKLQELTRNSLECFPSTQRLYMQSNLLRTLDKSLFWPLNQLEFVDLSRNQLTRIDLFTIMPHAMLKHVDLRLNQLADLSLSTDRAETQLEFFDASYNPNLSIDPAELVEFMIKSAPLRSIRFSGIKELRSIDRGASSESKDEQMLPQPIKSKVYLNRLDLVGASMDSDSISKLYHFLASDRIALESMFIDNVARWNNKVATERLIAARLHLDLEQLNLSGSHLENEHLISIMNASLSTMPEEAFFSLKHLNLSFCSIDSWPLNDKFSPKLAQLRSLDLSGNKIRYLIGKQDTLASYTLSQLGYLNLSSNAMIGLIAQPPAQDLQRVRLSQLMPSLRGIDLSHNRLSWIPTKFFENLSKLAWLRLDYNQIEIFPSNLVLSFVGGGRYVQFNFDHNTNMKPSATDDMNYEVSDHRLDSLVDASELILVPDRFDHLRCIRVDDYVVESIQQQSSSLIVNEIDEAQSRIRYLHAMEGDGIVSTAAEGDDAIDDEQCRTLISLTRSISFNSIGPNASANPDSFWSSGKLDNLGANQLYDLSLRHNDLTSIGDSKIGGVIRLDLSVNRLEKLPASSFCTNLMTLDLSHNQIYEFSLGWTMNCTKLTYLDLSYNRISSLVGHQVRNRVSGQHLGSLLVLKLRHNILTHLNGLPTYLLDGLRLLDLRSNQLKSMEFIQLELQRPLLTIIITNQSHEGHSTPEVDFDRPYVELDDKSLRFEWTEDEKSLKGKYSITVGSGRSISFLERHADQPIKFCRLDPHSTAEICLKRLESSPIDDHPITEKCLLLKKMPDTVPCLTDLQQAQASNDSGETLKADPSFKNYRAESRNSSTTAGLTTEEDFVLNMIDSMKKSWLKLRQVDINEYLANYMRAGSVWVRVGERYQINSLTVVKLAIVIGSVCIIGLMIAIFTLLTYFSHSKISPEHSDSGSASELTTVTSPNSNSFSSSSNKNDNRSTDCSTGSRARTSIQSSSEESQHLHETVLECAAIGSSRKSYSQGPLSLDYPPPPPDHLQQQRPQICVTPSSSLAPSSAETAETMQAVDSIQSGTPNTTTRTCVDQYTSGGDFCLDQSGQQDPQQQQVATVMRMVKSCSANFDNGMNRHGIGVPTDGVTARQYGTINPRQQLQQHSYQTLRMKTRQFHHNNQPGVQIPFQSQAQAFTAGLMTNDELPHFAEIDGLAVHNYAADPTTMSLLSLSSALSNSASNSNFVNSNYEAQTGTTPGEAHRESLCHYHSRMVQHNHQPIFDNNRKHTDSSTALGNAQPTGVIFEQDEEQSSYNLDSGLHLSVHNLPPPPPLPRTMEALQFYDVNTLYPNNN